MLAPLDRREGAQPLGAVGYDALRRAGRRRRALVGDEIDDREIDLVTDAAYDRDRAGVNGAGHGLVVERLQILERAAAAREDQHVAVSAAPGEAQRIDDLAGRGHALHGNRVDEDGHGRETPPEHVQDVADRRARGRGDHADPAWQGRQWLAMRRVEESFGRETALELLEAPAQQAFAGLLEVLDHDLEFAARLVEADAAACDAPWRRPGPGIAPAGCGCGTCSSAPAPRRP